MLCSTVWFVHFLVLKRKAVDVWLVEFYCATVTKSLKEAVADLIWVQLQYQQHTGCSFKKKLKKLYIYF